jgi:acetoacetyl-[acyl-carrier protein] synthase
MSRTAQAFGIESWAVAALKCYLGHSLGSASGDQVTGTLGVWHHGVIPGITTIDGIADDVCRDNLAFSIEHREVDPEQQKYAIINSKGFGGNNASATMFSPAVTRKMLQARYSASEWSAWERANETVRERGVLLDDDVEVGPYGMLVGGQPVQLDLQSPYDDMRID